jgi:hypothetical protein
MTAARSTYQWLGNLAEGDEIYLSAHPDALPSRVVEIDPADGTILVAPVRPGGSLGMPMFFGEADLDAIAQANEAHR